MTLHVGLKVDTSELERRLSRNIEKRIAFAVVNAINTTLKTIQRAVILQGREDFTIRKPAFFEREEAIIKPFANVGQGRAFGEIAVGQKKNLLLPQFQTGGVREPFVGKSSAVPVEARPSQQSSVPEELWIRRLGFKRPKATTKATRKGRRLGLVGKVWEGLQGTYLIPGAGIFQRIGSGASRVLYVFAQHVQLPKRLRFLQLALTIGPRDFARNLRNEIALTLARNEGRR